MGYSVVHMDSGRGRGDEHCIPTKNRNRAILGGKRCDMGLSKGDMDRIPGKDVGGTVANGWMAVWMMKTSSRTNVLYTPKASIKDVISYPSYYLAILIDDCSRSFQHNRSQVSALDCLSFTEAFPCTPKVNQLLKCLIRLLHPLSYDRFSKPRALLSANFDMEA